MKEKRKYGSYFIDPKRMKDKEKKHLGGIKLEAGLQADNTVCVD